MSELENYLLLAALENYLPLASRVIGVTRAQSQSSLLTQRLMDLGALVVEIPTIEITEPRNSGPFLAALSELETYSWVVLCSPNAARVFAQHLGARVLGTTKLACVGPGTAACLAPYEADFVPKLSSAVGFCAEFADAELAPAGAGGNSRVLIPRSCIARETMADGLRSKGYQVVAVEAYCTNAIEFDFAKILECDTLVFTSSSAADSLLQSKDFDNAKLTCALISMGEQTTKTIEKYSLKVAQTANPSTLDGLVEAVVQHQ